MKSGATYLLILDYGGDIAAVEKVIFTFVGAGTLARNYPTDISFSDGKFVVPFTQSDTLLLAGENGHLVETEVQINFKNHAVAKQSYPAFYIERTFATEIVPGNSPSGDIVLDHLSFKVDGSVIIAKVEGDVKPELIASMVDAYMKTHPIESGITEDECNSLIFDYVTAHKEELKGDTGETGPQGIQGPKGDIGEVGPQGPKGDIGEVGPQGPQGEPGVNGKDGKDGADGQKGDKGETGNVGPQGPKGDTGETGPQGPQGIPGEKGADGKNGVDGTNGKDGENYSIAVTTNVPDELLPNIFYRFGKQSDVFIAIANTEDESHLNEYMFEFVSGEIATDFSYDVGSITFVEEPVIEANKLYQGSIVNGVGLLVGVDYE